MTSFTWLRASHPPRCLTAADAAAAFKELLTRELGQDRSVSLGVQERKHFPEVGALVFRRAFANGASLYAWGTGDGLAIQAVTVAVSPVAATVPIELVWMEFWKKVSAWLAKRGIAAAAAAALDGPLPIGDLVAIGIGVWTIYELLENWEALWQAAIAAATALSTDPIKEKCIERCWRILGTPGSEWEFRRCLRRCIEELEGN